MAKKNKPDLTSTKIEVETVEPVKIHPLSQYKPEYAEMASRLIAAGFTRKSLGYLLGVCSDTIDNWRTKYPEFAAAYTEGKSGQLKRLIAKGLLEAAGYDYETSKTKTIHDAEGNLVKTETTTFKNKQPANHNLLMFILCNIDRQLGSDDWRSKHTLEVDNKTLNVTIDGKIVNEQIERLAGRIFSDSPNKVIESHEV